MRLYYHLALALLLNWTHVIASAIEKRATYTGYLFAYVSKTGLVLDNRIT